jgi:hypothetical protein
MTQRSTQSRAVSRCASPYASRYGRLLFCCLGLCVAVVVLNGCAAEKKTKVRTFPWATVNSVRPVLPKTFSSLPDSTMDTFPSEFELDAPPPPSPLATAQNTPPRPRVTPAPSEAPSSPSRPEAPQIAPQLTAEERAAAEQQTNLSLSIAERNISASQGRTLNPTQSDLASKVRSFVTEAREAAHLGDWTRATNAAKKAQVLSEELARSL